jgi:6-phosphogluconolactonase
LQLKYYILVIQPRILKLAIGVIGVMIMALNSTKGVETGKTSVANEARRSGRYLVYVGTYTGEKSKGIYVYGMDLATGSLTPMGLAAETPNPTFLDIDPKHRFLYAVNEIERFEGKAAGAVSSFSIDPATGKLTFLNQRSSGGSGPCHILLDRTGKNALVANYGGGSVAVLPIEKDGKLGEASAFIQHQGRSIHPERQTGPRAHCMIMDAQNRFALACDLGLDKVLIYKFDAKKGTLVPNDPAFASIKAGSGPRHVTFSPNGRHAYVLNELQPTIVVFDYDAKRGVLNEAQTISTVPDDFKGTNYGAEIEVHPSGKFLYASNRGHDSIAIFAIDPKKGTLTLVEHQPTQGKTPRHFGIDPTGKYLLAANQDSNSIVVFGIDAENGRLKPTGQVLELGAPVCVKFMPMGSQ